MQHFINEAHRLLLISSDMIRESANKHLKQDKSLRVGSCLTEPGGVSTWRDWFTGSRRS